MKYLVIVESPTKVKTIKKFLGSNYEVQASNGHVRDLPKSQLGIDIENDFEPKYITIRGKGEKLAELRKAAKKVDKVLLATDPDREGEAISWHLSKALKLDESKMERITFNEITQSAVKNSLKHPRDIDMNLVDAQQARRTLDRMVGYGISPLLWKKIKRGLSAGRVQSVTLRIICDREEEINSFVPEEYWTLDAILNITGEKRPLIAKFYGDEKGKINITNKQQMDTIMEELENPEFKVAGIKHGERSKTSPLPFTTSTLQQEASKGLNFSTQKTMRIAQQLYEGIDVKKKGTIGLISYLRTDSTRISDEADLALKEYITNTHGKEYVLKTRTKKENGSKIQDAHEAIRPTNVDLTPAVVKDDLSRDQFRLYQLIWRRAVASRMQNAKYETTSIKLNANRYIFKVSASKLVFDGFTAVYVEEDDEKEGSNVLLNKIKDTTEFSLAEMDAKQHFTQPPAHFTESALVKALEELGVGRPSTYAPTIGTIIARRYVAKENKNLYVTELGEAVNSIMLTAFPAVVDPTFTANMESLLDMVEEGKVKWKSVISNFYPDLDLALKEAEEKLEKILIEDEITDTVCELCGSNMVVKYGPHGKFLACPKFPECRNTKPYFEKTGIECPKCGKEVVIRKTKKGRKYFGCENNPECDFMSWQKPLEVKCRKCGSYMIEKGEKAVCSNETCGHSEKIKITKQN
ncbi:DNA topoisomerase I [Parasporobacterium paucivorans DSM 15970]|uniref:DNA topoisomerase 1 n=1 Tax=Parasporobacterium paucivorans DSM 15970 TaxID=1122934 RepID=A0A1M6G920_9FIRM|nr:type I DNA topoisomerase [Parasporobacterium paucivorans]SHJ06460.1 DNA topoisomerase I [Parasporobacterium paucivorans DSM 15970]